MQATAIWLAVGGNIRGEWGEPREAFDRTLTELEAAGLSVIGCSGLFMTLPVGTVRQPDFLNAVLGVEGSTSPASLLRLLKSFERRAGRRVNGKWGPRPLDLDILDFGGRVLGRSIAPRRHGELILPHPEMVQRGFVMVPFAEVAPHWMHPRLGQRAAALLKARPQLGRGVRRVGDWRRA